LKLDAKLVLELGSRGQNVRDTRGEARTWPEVRQVVEVYASRHGTQDVRTDRDKRVQAILRLFADGYSAAELVETVRLALQDEFWRDKPLGAILANPGRRDELRGAPEAHRVDPDLARRQAQDLADIEADRRRTRAGAATGATEGPLRTINGQSENRSLASLVEGIG
jgi:hypothetical protein